MDVLSTKVLDMLFVRTGKAHVCGFLVTAGGHPMLLLFRPEK